MAQDNNRPSGPEPLGLIADALMQAVAHHQAGRLREAEQAYRAILRVQPRHPEANHRLGSLAVSVGRVEAGLSLFETACRTDPSVSEYWVSRADALVRLGRHDAAQSLLGEARRSGLNDGGVRMLRQHLAAHPVGEASVTRPTAAQDQHKPSRFSEKWRSRKDKKKNRKKSVRAASPSPARTPTDDTLYQQALQAHQSGDIERAEAFYRQVLAQRSGHSDALHNLGLLLFQRGRAGEAEALMRRAVAVNDRVAAYHCHHGVILKALGRLEEALQAYTAALRIDPEYAEAHYNRGIGLNDLGRAQEALKAYDKALRNKPKFAEAHNNRGNVLKALGCLEEALKAYESASQIRPTYAEAHCNRGNVLRTLGKFQESLRACDQALRFKPQFAEAHSNRGNALNELGRTEEALEAYDAALRLQPEYAEVLVSCGAALSACGRQGEAVQAYEKALRIKPGDTEAHCRLGNALSLLGRFGEALQTYDRALRIDPDYREAASNRLFMLHYLEGEQAVGLLSEARRHAGTLWPRVVEPHVFPARPAETGRRLRVGYVSGDFRRHAVGFFVQDLFARHDRTRIEVWAYPTNGMEDEITARIKASVDHWQPLAGLNDDAAAARIRADGIDVLIDLSGHTAHNRLGVFAQRAAPVQAHYLGFMGSTGVPNMDYWIGDDLLTPGWMADAYAECLWPLPRVWVAYHGAEDAPQPAWSPRDDGTLWLGSFNTLLKLTPHTVALWARVLHALPEGKLLLKTRELADEGNRDRVLQAFAGHGIADGRIELQDRRATPSWPAHMAYYDRLDIALDPVGPVSGGTTSCDALWMGVPVITRLGDRMGSRMSAAMLNAMGCAAWIAEDDEAYIAKAVALARDVGGRRAIRFTQRERMRRSPLCDAQGLAAALEEAYARMVGCWHARQGEQVENG
jgi:predicted O-linked N-acetylglucosamine transferase (SPINDLY family)